MKKSKVKNFFKLIFKNFFYSLFKIKHGKISYKQNIQNELFEEMNVFFEENNTHLNYSIYSSKNSRLYTNRIQDTAVIKNNILLDKPSFQLRDNIFDQDIKKNIVLKIGTPYVKKNLNGTVLSLLTGGAGNNNFFHWLFDVLPRIAIVEKKDKLREINFFLCPELNKWQLETLDILGISKTKCLSSVHYRHIESNNIITTSHPWVRTENIINEIENLPSWISNWLKQKFLPFKSNNKFPKKFFIDRSDSTSNLKDLRYIINENEVLDFVKSKGFETIKLSELSFKDELKLFNDADTVIGLQGAGLTNLIWCNQNTKIIELRSKLTNKLFENLAFQNQINFKKLEYDPIEKFVADHYGSIKVDIKELEKII